MLQNLAGVAFLIVGVLWVVFAFPLARVGASFYFSTTDMELRTGRRYRAIRGLILASCVGKYCSGSRGCLFRIPLAVWIIFLPVICNRNNR